MFYGHDGTECEEFIHEVRLFAHAHDMEEDRGWIARKAAVCFVEDALRWHIALDDQTKADWTLLEQCLIKEFPRDDSRVSGYAARSVLHKNTIRD